MSPSECVDITVRPAIKSDIAEMSETLAGELSPEQLANRWLECVAGNRVMLVGLLDGDVAGTVSMGGHNHQRPNSLRLFALDVAPEYRRHGVGSALVREVEREAGLRGLGQVNLEVAVENGGAARLYESLGYRRLGQPIIDRWQRHTPGQGWQQVEGPAWIMSKDVRTHTDWALKSLSHVRSSERTPAHRRGVPMAQDPRATSRRDTMDM